MRLIAALLLLALIICLSSCAPATPVLLRPQLEIPARPEPLGISWSHQNGRHCLDDEQAKNLLINIERLYTHIAILEGYIKAANGTNLPDNPAEGKSNDKR